MIWTSVEISQLYTTVSPIVSNPIVVKYHHSVIFYSLCDFPGASFHMQSYTVTKSWETNISPSCSITLCSKRPWIHPLLTSQHSTHYTLRNHGSQKHFASCFFCMRGSLWGCFAPRITRKPWELQIGMKTWYPHLPQSLFMKHTYYLLTSA